MYHSTAKFFSLIEKRQVATNVGISVTIHGKMSISFKGVQKYFDPDLSILSSEALCKIISLELI